MKIKQIKLTEEQKTFFKPFLEHQVNARLMQSNGAQFEREGSKKLLKAIKELFPEIPEINESLPVVSHEEDEDWVITYMDKGE